MKTRTFSAALLAVLLPVIIPAAAWAIDVTPQAPPGTEKVLTIVKWVAWGGAIAGVTGIIVCAIMMMLAHRRGEQPGEMLGKVLIGCVLVTAAGAIVGFLIPGV